MSARPPRGLLLACVLVAGCGHKRVAPPGEATLTLGGRATAYHDWSKTKICDADPRLAAADIRALDAALQDFLGQTSAGKEGVWADEHIALLEEGLRELPPALASEEKAVAEVRDCMPADEKLLDDADLRTGDELVRQAKKRVEEGPELLRWVKAKRDIARFKDALPAQLEKGRQSGCPPRPKPANADLFFSYEDDHGKTEWLFCDGSRVVAVPGNKPEFVPDPASKRKPNPKTYLDAAAKYPGAQVLRSPKLPDKPAKADSTPEPIDDPG